MMSTMAEDGPNVIMITLAVPFLRKTRDLLDQFTDAKKPVRRLPASKLATGTAHVDLDDTPAPTEGPATR
jgi:hypothetical protein